jgi:hypothetical protein
MSCVDDEALYGSRLCWACDEKMAGVPISIRATVPLEQRSLPYEPPDIGELLNLEFPETTGQVIGDANIV